MALELPGSSIPRDRRWTRPSTRRRSRPSKTAGGRTGRSGRGWAVIRKKGEAPTIVVEFVSRGKVNQERDYIAKRAEYREIGVREYWVIDRFRRTLTVYTFSGESDQEQRHPGEAELRDPVAPRFRAPIGPIVDTGRSLGQEEAALNRSPCVGT